MAVNSLLATESLAGADFINGTAPVTAAEAGHEAVVKRPLADGRVDIRPHARELLCSAARSGSVAIVERIISADEARIDAKPNATEALGCAAKFGHLPVVE